MTRDTGTLTTISKARTLARSGAARSIRIGAELSLRDVAAVLGVSPSTILRWEAGTRRPRADLAVPYGELLERLMRPDA